MSTPNEKAACIPRSRASVGITGSETEINEKGNRTAYLSNREVNETGTSAK